MRRQNGFTLMEIIVTVVIVGIMASMAMVKYNDFQLRQHERNAMLKLREVAAAAEIFKTRHGRYPCKEDSAGNCIDYYGASEEIEIQDALEMDTTIQQEPFDLSCRFSGHNAPNDSFFCWCSYPIVPGNQWEKRIFQLKYSSTYTHPSKIRCSEWACTDICDCQLCGDPGDNCPNIM